MDLTERIQRNLGRLQSELGEEYWRTSASRLTLLPMIESALDEFADGRLLDAGAGNLLYKPILTDYCEEYESLDIIENPDLDYRQDIQDLELSSNQYDTVFCRNVLEHVPCPAEAMSEIQRVLKPGGHAIVTVPHLAYLHNEPHDFYRFTSHGMNHLVERAGLTPISIDEAGGLFSFLGYSFATFVLGMTYSVPVLSTFALKLNNPIQEACVKIDGAMGNEKHFPLNYILVAGKQ